MHTEVWWGNLENGHYKQQSQNAVWTNKDKNCLQWWTWVLELLKLWVLISESVVVL
jgi:hypothetical protein